MRITKIVFVTGSQGWGGGVERACANLANQLAETGEYCIVILSSMAGLRSTFSLHDDIVLEEVYPTQRSIQLIAPAFLWRLRRKLRQHDPDIIVVVESFLSAFVIPAAFGLHARLINWEHFNADVTLGTPLRRIARKMAAHWCSHVVVLTQSDKRRWQEKYSIDEDRISVIYNMNPLPHACVKRDVESQPTVLAVGRLSYEKGFDMLLDAWSCIPEEIRHGWRLKIVGEGDERPALLMHAKKIDITAQVMLPGRRDNMAAEYMNADIFVLSSRFEGFGLSLLEAMTFGLPVAAFDCPDGPREMIENDVNGCLVPPLDVDHLAATLSKLMTSADDRTRLGKKARLTVERFNPEAIVSQWLPLLQSNEFCP